MTQAPLTIGAVTFPVIEPARRLALLEPPAPGSRLSMVLDTDTYNEIDDQFALVQALLSPELDVEAVYAAPYFNKRSTGPADGMERSYEEILRVYDRLGMKPNGAVYRGSTQYMAGPDQPVESDAARNLIERAMQKRDNGPLYVPTIGAPTNVASAILMEPRIIERIVIVWLGGQPHTWVTAKEFNLQQDLHASRVLFNSGVPLVQIPCKNVAEHLRTTVAELSAHIKGKSGIGDYLADIVAGYHDDHFAWSKVIWDISAIAWLLNPTWTPSDLVHSPILTSEMTWSHDTRRHFMRVVTGVSRDRVFGDVFRKIAAAKC